MADRTNPQLPKVSEARPATPVLGIWPMCECCGVRDQDVLPRTKNLPQAHPRCRKANNR